MEGVGTTGRSCESDCGDDLNKSAEFYKPLIELYGGDVKAFGHGTIEGTFKRYWAATQVCPLVGKNVLDVGCAYGGLVPFVVGAGVKSYFGIDAVHEFILEADKRWANIGDRVKVNFACYDFDQFGPGIFDYDVVFALGVGVSHESHKACERRMIQAFSMAREGVVFSLSKGSTANDDWLLHSACKLTNRVVLKRDYWLPDQMVYLYKVGNDKE